MLLETLIEFSINFFRFLSNISWFRSYFECAPQEADEWSSSSMRKIYGLDFFLGSLWYTNTELSSRYLRLRVFNYAGVPNHKSLFEVWWVRNWEDGFRSFPWETSPSFQISSPSLISDTYLREIFIILLEINENHVDWEVRLTKEKEGSFEWIVYIIRDIAPNFIQIKKDH